MPPVLPFCSGTKCCHYGSKHALCVWPVIAASSRQVLMPAWSLTRCRENNLKFLLYFMLILSFFDYYSIISGGFQRNFKADCTTILIFLFSYGHRTPEVHRKEASVLLQEYRCLTYRGQPMFRMITHTLNIVTHDDSDLCCGWKKEFRRVENPERSAFSS